ncbi:S8 family serine peptidase [Sinorhizobium meliloti]|uniref:S8 family serine peptidase n=1 Tax=Rhizobium meliloti TaxID=382 RepID=UPI000FD730D7|nr:S8 family serine peptidase [Sinorhizobium meliloti]RVM04188.1 peptidase S8 [Sinorhizobium meliloti]RVO23330.1 peptidase S8 [Sinorhizobium meliloti]
MKAFDAKDRGARPVRPDSSDQILRVAVTFNPPGEQVGPTKFGARMSAETAEKFAPDSAKADLALAELARRGFTLTARGPLSASMRCTKSSYEALFNTKLSRMAVPGGAAAQMDSVLFPAEDAPWDPDPAIAALLDDVYIQWPHIYMAKARGAKAARRATQATIGLASTRPTAAPPPVPYFNLAAPADIARQLNATRVHLQGITGKGVRVAMIDSGFAHDHSFFRAHRFSSSVVLAPGAADRSVDGNGHGTGESANVFSIAPGANFIGIKLDNEAYPESSASILEGFQEALKHDPHVISVSLGYDLRGQDNTPLARLPNSLIALEVEIQAAVRRGIVIVFSAGNGHYSFPGQMPEVISAGGVYVDENGAMRASDYASAFHSTIYSGRSIPDVCGLVGLLPHANYLALPVPPRCEIDVDGAVYDGTGPADGWGVFSGTSAAAPQLAGLCALMLQVQPKLSPTDIKAILRRTARDVMAGHANPASDPAGRGVPAHGGEDGATGAGLADAHAAVMQLL